MLERLRQELRRILDERADEQRSLDAVITKAEERADGTFTEAEQAEFRTLADSIRAKDEQRVELEAQITEQEEMQAARQAAADAEQRAGVQAAGDPAGVRVGNEERTYSQASSMRDGVSFFADLVQAGVNNDPTAQERLNRHRQEASVDAAETRAVGTGAFSGVTVPSYLTDMVAPLARALRPFADICNHHDLPSEGMTVEISRITTGTSAGIQATENATVSTNDIDDTTLSVPVRTIAGSQDISFQALARSRGADEIVVSDLVRAYHTALDNTILNDDGTSGTHLGVRNVSGNAAVTYTDASPTAAELWPKLFDLVQKIQSGVFLGVSHFVMHPRRFWWVASNVGTNFPFIQLSGVPQQGGTVETFEYGQGPSGILGGIPVIVDANLPTGLGSGTDEDTILAVAAPECHLWEDPGPLQAKVEAPASLGVTLAVYGFSAFTAGRYPLATGDITGTGLVAPTF